LSGGQQQRVALARALAVRPRCLLLDEPLSNLDAKLRQEMRQEIRRICKRGEFTTIYVTHDQKEALSVADRIGLLRDGRLVQVGTPGELYHRPRTSWVADFIGQTNLLKGKVVGRDGNVVRVETGVGVVCAKIEAETRRHGDTQMEREVVVSVRPEQIRVAKEESGRRGIGETGNRVRGTVVESTFLGEASEHVVVVNGERLRVICAPPMFDVKEEMVVEFDAEDVVVLAE
jgi:iron(III) transport system ATP-binding protein